MHLLMALVVAGTWVLPDRFLPGSALFALVGIGAYAAALGLGPPARQELFWHGLGGAPGVREATRLLLHISLVAGALLSVRGAELDNVLWTGLGSLCALSLLGFARSWASSQAGRLLVVAGSVILSLATLVPSLWIAKWPLVLGGELRLGALVLGALVARLLLARRRPASAAGRKRHAWAWVALPLSTGLVSVVEAAWMVPVASRSASSGRLMIPSRADPLRAGQRVWRVDDGCGTTSAFPDGLPLAFELEDRQRQANGRRPIEQGPRPGTIVVHHSDGTVQIWDFVAGGPE